MRGMQGCVKVVTVSFYVILSGGRHRRPSSNDQPFPAGVMVIRGTVIPRLRLSGTPFGMTGVGNVPRTTLSRLCAVCGWAERCESVRGNLKTGVAAG